MPAAILLLNPAARAARRRGWLETVRAELSKRFALQVIDPESASDVTRTAREGAASGASAVIVAGGDGTVNAAVAGLAGSATPLGILPLGSGNDLARELAIPSDPHAAARRIVDGTPTALDLAVVNGHPFCTVGGLVLVASSTLSVTRWRERSRILRALTDAFGDSVYRLSATMNLLAGRRIVEHVRIDWRERAGCAPGRLEMDVHAVFVANHRTLGGGLVLPVEGSARDGVLEICVVPRRSRASLVLAFARLSAGRPIGPDVLRVMHATHAVIRTSRADAFVADGETLAMGNTFEIGVRPRALHVIL